MIVSTQNPRQDPRQVCQTIAISSVILLVSSVGLAYILNIHSFSSSMNVCPELTASALGGIALSIILYCHAALKLKKQKKARFDSQRSQDPSIFPKKAISARLTEHAFTKLPDKLKVLVMEYCECEQLTTLMENFGISKDECVQITNIIQNHFGLPENAINEGMVNLSLLKSKIQNAIGEKENSDPLHTCIQRWKQQLSINEIFSIFGVISQYNQELQRLNIKHHGVGRDQGWRNHALYVAIIMLLSNRSNEQESVSSNHFAKTFYLGAFGLEIQNSNAKIKLLLLQFLSKDNLSYANLPSFTDIHHQYDLSRIALAHRDTVRFMINRGVLTPNQFLQWACALGWYDFEKLWKSIPDHKDIQHSICQCFENDNKRTLLHYAVLGAMAANSIILASRARPGQIILQNMRRNNAEFYLSSNLFSINVMQEISRRALDFQAGDHIETIKALRVLGADPSAKDENNQSPIDLAQSYNMTNVLTALTERIEIPEIADF